jgi:hypothetical protein
MSLSLHQEAPEGSVIWWLIGVAATEQGEHQRKSEMARSQTTVLHVDPTFILRTSMPDDRNTWLLRDGY